MESRQPHFETLDSSAAYAIAYYSITARFRYQNLNCGRWDGLMSGFVSRVASGLGWLHRSVMRAVLSHHGHFRASRFGVTTCR
jgi:hypothetical protein